jgi:hypothetical protein
MPTESAGHHLIRTIKVTLVDAVPILPAFYIESPCEPQKKEPAG